MATPTAAQAQTTKIQAGQDAANAASASKVSANKSTLPVGVGYQTYNPDGSVNKSYSSDQAKTMNATGGSVDTAPITPVGVQPVPPVTGANGQPPVATGMPQTDGAISSIKDPVTGQTFTRNTADPASTYQPVNKYKEGLAAAQASGLPAPADAGAARMGVAKYTPNQPDTSAVDSYISDDPGVNKLMQGITKLLNPQQQTTSLLADYQSLYKESGLANINAEIINADKVINGTEGDIRNEIEKAGGFGTESQVQAMTLARNKSLLTRYNQLVQMKTDATNQLNTLSTLNAQDKQMAQTRLNTQIDAMFKVATFQQQAQNNIKEAFNNMVSKIGYAGAYAAYSTNPRQLASIEQVTGLGSGGLQKLASQPDLDLQSKTLDLQLKKAQIANTYSEISARNNARSNTLNGKPQTATQAQVQGYADRTNQADQILNNFGSKFTGAAAGIASYLPNFLKSSDRQMYEQAERNFVNSVLRRESGAAISQSEFDNAEKQYFPQAGDSSQVVEQKSANRRTVINNLYQQSNLQAPVLPGQVIQSSDGQHYKVGDDGETITPV